MSNYNLRHSDQSKNSASQMFQKWSVTNRWTGNARRCLRCTCPKQISTGRAVDTRTALASWICRPGIGRSWQSAVCRTGPERPPRVGPTPRNSRRVRWACRAWRTWTDRADNRSSMCRCSTEAGRPVLEMSLQLLTVIPPIRAGRCNRRSKNHNNDILFNYIIVELRTTTTDIRRITCNIKVSAVTIILLSMFYDFYIY